MNIAHYKGKIGLSLKLKLKVHDFAVKRSTFSTDN